MLTKMPRVISELNKMFVGPIEYIIVVFRMLKILQNDVVAWLDESHIPGIAYGTMFVLT